MDLQNFVKTTIIQIMKAVKESSDELKLDEEIFVGTKADKRCIEFDVAVSVEENKTKGGKAGIKVLEFGELGGGIDKEMKNSTVSRIQFGVYTPKPKKLTRNNSSD